MTINLSDNSPRVSYSVAAGVTQTSFTVSFEFFDNDDLNVYVDGVLKTLTTDYSVSGGDGSTGTITMSVTGASGGSTVVITRDIDLDRTTDFPSSGPFNIASLNTELDRFVAIAADLKDQSDRALQLTDYDSAVGLTLPEVDDRKGKTLAFNSSTGAVEAGPTISDVQSVSDAAADIQTLAHIEDGTDATDAIQTVAGIASDVPTVAGISSNVTTVASISSDVTAVAGDATDISTVAGISTEVGRLGTADAVSDLNTLGTADVVADMNTLGTALNVTNMNTVASSITNVNTVATNISDINNFSDVYRVDSSDPTTDLDEGDLAYNTTSNNLKYYNGTNWVSIEAAGSTVLVSNDGTPLTTAASTLNFTGTGVVASGTGAIKNITITNTEYPLSDFSNNGLMSSSDNQKLYYIEELAEENVPSFRTIQVSGETDVVAGNKEDTLTFEAGTHTQIYTSAANKRVSIRSTLVDATTSVAGLMSASDKTKINGIDASANNYSLPTASASVLGGIKIGAGLSIDGSGVVTSSGSGGLSNVVDDTTPQLGGNLDVNGNDIVSTSNGAIDLDPNGSGKVTFKGNATRGAGQFVLNCEQNSHGITIKGPAHSAGANYTLTLPDNDGSSGQSLITDGSGNTSWSTISGGGGGADLYAANESSPTAQPSATGANAVAIGDSSLAALVGKLAYASGQFAASGDAQGGQFILRADTTDATATVLTANNSAAGSTNQIVAASDTAITFDGTITAMQNGAQAYASWKIEGLIVNDGGTTTLVNSATTVISNADSWGMALSADNTNNALAITCTGEAAHNIRWVANIRTTECTFS